jgi:hypothetical protein
MSERPESVEAMIRASAERDPGFRARLREDPAAAVAEMLGVDMSDGVRIRVVEESPGEVVLVIPAGVADPGDLSLAELELIADGRARIGGSGR